MATTNNRRYKQNTPAPQIAENELGKRPPQATELEEMVLGALMIEKDAYSNIADLLLKGNTKLSAAFVFMIA